MSDERFSPGFLRVDPACLPPKKMQGPKPRPRGGKFLKGPIPMSWIETASTLPGKALVSGLVIWFERFCSKSTSVKFSLRKLADKGIPKSTGRRALRALEKAGLISVRRPSGRSMEVTLICEVDPVDRLE